MKIISIIQLLFFSVITFSQNEKYSNPLKDEEKIKAEKVAFITEKIDLTVKEAQDFWPVFNEHETKMNKLFEEERSITKELEKNLNTLSEKEISDKNLRLINIRVERANIEKEYYEKYKTVLSCQKIALFYKSDREFRKHLLKKYKDKCE